MAVKKMTLEDHIWASKRLKKARDLHLTFKGGKTNADISKRSGDDGLARDDQESVSRPKSKKGTTVRKSDKNSKDVPGRSRKKVARRKTKKRGR